MRFVMLLLGLVFTHGYANAHEWTPTYPTLSPSYVEGVSKADMLLVNMRNDVKYFELSVFDNDWNAVPFATKERIVRVDYLQRLKIEVFIRDQDKDTATYICSKSKILKGSETKALVASRICSKIKI